MKAKTAAVTVIVMTPLVLLSGMESEAGERLEKRAIVELFSDTTVNAHFMKEGEQIDVMTGRVDLKYELSGDGSAKKTTYPAKAHKGTFTESGKWWAGKKGGFCTLWTPENKQRCRRVERTPQGTYELHDKRYTIFIDDISPKN